MVSRFSGWRVNGTSDKAIREDEFYCKYLLKSLKSLLDGICSVKVAKIGVLKFWNFPYFPWKKSRQNEMSSALFSLNVDTVSRIFSGFFGTKKIVI